MKVVLGIVHDSSTVVTYEALFLKQCRNLTSIALDCLWSEGTCQGVQSLVTVLEQGYLSHLEDLTLEHNVCDSQLSSCLQAVSHLNRLSCASTVFGSREVEALTPHFSALKYLRLSNCIILDGHMIQALNQFYATTVLAEEILLGMPYDSYVYVFSVVSRGVPRGVSAVWTPDRTHDSRLARTRSARCRDSIFG